MGKKRKHNLKLWSLCLAGVIAFASLTLFQHASATENGYAEVEGGLRLDEVAAQGSVVTIPDEVNGTPVVEIGSNAFQDRDDITEVTIPKSVKVIPENCFRGKKKLLKVTAPGVERIEKNAFRNSAIKEMDLSKVTYFGEGAFANSQLTDMRLLSAEEIGAEAFSGLHNLTSVVLGTKLTNIGEAAFAYAYRLESINLPESLTALGESAFYQNIRLHTVASKSSSFVVQDGVLYNADQSALILYPAAKAGTLFVIPSSVTKICENAFNGNLLLKSVKAGNQVKDIGEGAFSAMPSLNTLDLPLAGEKANYVFGTIPYEGCKKVKATIAGEETYFCLPKNLKAYSVDDYATDLKNQLAKKNFSILGDSISTFAGYSNNAAETNSTIGNNEVYYTGSNYITDVSDTWWMRTALKTGMNVLVDNAWSGDKVTERGADRCLQLHDDTGTNAGTNPDIIAVYFGINDYINGVTAENFKTAYEAMISSMKVKYAAADIFLFGYVPNEDRTTIRPLTDMISYNEIVKEAAAKYGCTYVDLYNESGITPDNVKQYMGDADNGAIHPNVAGAAAISDAFLNALYNKYIVEGQ